MWLAMGPRRGGESFLSTPLHTQDIFSELHYYYAYSNIILLCIPCLYFSMGIMCVYTSSVFSYDFC